MSVLAEAISVVVRTRTIEEKYPGGLLGYRADCPNQTFCTDGQLARVGFMVPEDVGDFVQRLKRHGFDFTEIGEFTDIAVVDQMIGPTAPCSWLHFGKHPDGYSLVWLKGTDPHSLYVPDNWTVSKGQKMQFFSPDEFVQRLLQVAEEDRYTISIDLNTGKEIIIARLRRQK